MNEKSSLFDHHHQSDLAESNSFMEPQILCSSYYSRYSCDSAASCQWCSSSNLCIASYSTCTSASTSIWGDSNSASGNPSLANILPGFTPILVLGIIAQIFLTLPMRCRTRNGLVITPVSTNGYQMLESKEVRRKHRLSSLALHIFSFILVIVLMAVNNWATDRSSMKLIAGFFEMRGANGFTTAYSCPSTFDNPCTLLLVVMILIFIWCLIMLLVLLHLIWGLSSSLFCPASKEAKRDSETTLFMHVDVPNSRGCVCCCCGGLAHPSVPRRVLYTVFLSLHACLWFLATAFVFLKSSVPGSDFIPGPSWFLLLANGLFSIFTCTFAAQHKLRVWTGASEDVNMNETNHTMAAAASYGGMGMGAPVMHSNASIVSVNYPGAQPMQAQPMPQAVPMAVQPQMGMGAPMPMMQPLVMAQPVQYQTYSTQTQVYVQTQPQQQMIMNPAIPAANATSSVTPIYSTGNGKEAAPMPSAPPAAMSGNNNLVPVMLPLPNGGYTMAYVPAQSPMLQQNNNAQPPIYSAGPTVGVPSSSSSSSSSMVTTGQAAPVAYAQPPGGAPQPSTDQSNYAPSAIPQPGNMHQQPQNQASQQAVPDYYAPSAISPPPSYS